ncbi:Rap guanine nucleotide exchange factor 6 [Chelonia mydas]|uniref:Rap guanine nucleotide exchange factor 6 n=1 Tax=Chelonia mydas TaxID=8469 RepID=M7B9Q8_CHEMY|nr:Rap guanine nucleotide exchange factor 6 [Chelonia mydas]
MLFLTYFCNVYRVSKLFFSSFSLLYSSPDDIGTCWYILLSGSVFIKESMFLPRSSFGKRSAGSFRRGCECIVLEPSEMIVVDYMDENEEYFQRQASHRQSRRRFRKINQKGERQTIIDTVDPYPVGKPPLPRGYHTHTIQDLPFDCSGLFSEQTDTRLHSLKDLQATLKAPGASYASPPKESLLSHNPPLTSPQLLLGRTTAGSSAGVIGGGPLSFSNQDQGTAKQPSASKPNF